MAVPAQTVGLCLLIFINTDSGSDSGGDISKEAFELKRN